MAKKKSAQGWGVSASADRAGGASPLSRDASQPKALIAYAESFGEFASMCFAGFKP